MNNFYQSDPSQAQETESPQAITIVPAKKALGARIMDRWHSFASPPPPSPNATVPQREKYRRARSVSGVAFYALLLMLFLLPTTFGMKTFWMSLFITISLVIAPFFNRIGQGLIAGILIVFSLQLMLMFYILTMTPLTASALQTYDSFSIVILLSLAVLPIRITWFLTLLDCAFIILDFIYQPHNAAITNLINNESLGWILIRPVLLVTAVACGGSLLLANIAKAVRQSYEAELIASIERVAAQQNEMEAEAKRELEESIQQIVQAHTDAMNGRTRERIPYPMAKVLWPLVGIQNTLWARLQSLQRREQEFFQLQEDIMKCNEILQHSLRSPEKPLAPYHTKTILAPLTLSIANLHKEMLKRLRGQTDLYSKW